jgi:hypothetical protein
MRLLPIMIALALGACSSDFMSAVERTEQANRTAPVDYKADILLFMRTYLNDPTNVRGAFVSEPELRTLDGASRYAVCLRYNAKKSSGQYAGSKDSMVLFRSGRLDRIIDNAREQCRDARYQPFPELERLTR